MAKWNGTRVSVKILDKESCLQPDSVYVFSNCLSIYEITTRRAIFLFRSTNFFTSCAERHSLFIYLHITPASASSLFSLFNDFLFSTCWYIHNHRNAFKHELELLEKARHPNVIQFVGAVTQKIPMMIVLEHPSKVSFIDLSLCLSLVLLVSGCTTPHILIFLSGCYTNFTNRGAYFHCCRGFCILLLSISSVCFLERLL